MLVRDLKIDEVYFFVSYHDRNLLIPEIKTYLYLGIDLIPDEAKSPSYYFQEADKYIELGKWDNNLDAENYGLVVVREDILDNIFDYAGLQNELDEMMKNHKKYGSR